MTPRAARFAAVEAPARWKAIDFISDLHLAEDTPRAFALWAGYLRETTADAVFILGDLFEVWVGDDARGAGFEARCAAVLADAASRRTLGFMVGNRDFLLGDAMLDAIGAVGLADPTVLWAFGRRVLLSHGDAMCIGDLPYQQFRRVVRAPQWQRQFLARPLAERRSMAKDLRAESERLKAGPAAGAGIDVDTATALELLRDANASALIHGHTHRPADTVLAPGMMRHVLSDWHLDDTPHPRAEVLRWNARGMRRLQPAAAISATP